MYTAICKPQQLCLGTGTDVCIVSGWTPREMVVKQLIEDEYAVIGNLYSPSRGISFLIRNLLANPQISTIVLLSATKEDHISGSVQCFYDFLRNGVEKVCTGYRIKSDIAGIIEADIEEHYLEQLVTRFKDNTYFVESLEAMVKLVRNSFVKKDATVYDKVVIPPKDIDTVCLPGVLIGQRVEAPTIAEAWVKLLYCIRKNGVIRHTGYDGKWQELLDLVTVVTDEPDTFVFTDYLNVSEEFIYLYIPSVLTNTKEEGVKYTYGTRMRSYFSGVDQVQQVIDKLKREIDSASAVISLWDVKDHFTGGSPCLNHIWLRITEDCLHMTATFRSNDMYSAWVSNAMGLRALQQLIAREVGVRMGCLVTISQSAHIYDDCFEAVDTLLTNNYGSVTGTTYGDACGNFSIETRNGSLKVEQTAPDGTYVTTYIGNRPLILVRDICRSNPSIEAEHAAYLGVELRRAYGCLVDAKKYVQDRGI